ncbi:MAG: excinuclease ABC subunit UvrA [Bacteroidetes bacterium]|nr:excinuclease ABC subunit UvrA [Bacteroidota bacterium]
MDTIEKITITNASEHNLRSVSVEFPKNKLIVVTGVSGSGKSSLIFDVLYREAESRYLGSLSSFARQFMGKLKKPAVERIDGLSPAIALDQKSVVSNPRSTVGTITGIYDSLRLLFARVGKVPEADAVFPVTRSLFSFNSPEGACPACKGLGVEDFLEPELLISDENKTLREGALVITAPNGYIIYSQVTLDVLDQVCRSEGFHIDIPWKELTPQQKHIVLYGSDKIEIPFGKHPLESRMKWSGITAKPRELGYYKGIIPVMETILQRDRNRNILRFVRSGKCRSCRGLRLNERALSASCHGYNIAELAALQLDDLQQALREISFPGTEKTIAEPIVNQVSKQIDLLKRLGLGYLTTDRDSTTLSAGESQRLRLANQAGMGLSGMICIFDEPSIGLHPNDVRQLIDILKEIRDKGNTVIVVEHEEAFIHHADWLIDIGPGPGLHGGEVMFSGTLKEAAALSEAEILRSRTLSFLYGFEKISIPVKRRPGSGFITIEGAAANNLQEIDVKFCLHALNVVTGVSGAGKSTLTNHILGAFLKNKLHHTNVNVGKFQCISGLEDVGKLILIDQSPIGRTPRSNPATYTGLFDPVRDLFSMQPESVIRGYDKSRFSFNTQGGRCESCEGAGYQQIGMHFMGNVEVLCESCEGRRFDEQTLDITFQGKNISEILEMTVSEAVVFFSAETKILRYVETLDHLGLGYLTLGQRSSTLSGGEAQRIKLATELAKTQSEHTLYIMDEPTTGLHHADVGVLLAALDKLIAQGHTVILIEHHLGIIAAADHIVDLGPGSGRDGGILLFSGSPEEMVKCQPSLTAQALKEYLFSDHSGVGNLKSEVGDLKSEKGNLKFEKGNLKFEIGSRQSLFLKGVSTHNLKDIDVEIPHNKITVITGVSGSGKSSLAFDTVFAEGQNRFLESFSPYARTRLGVQEQAAFEEISGLTPTFAIDQGSAGRNPRSTVGTVTGIYDHYRLLFSRLGSWQSAVGSRQLAVGSQQLAVGSRQLAVGSWQLAVGSRQSPSSSLFSFNHQHGACPACDGLGYQTVCDTQKLISNPEKSLLRGAMDGTKTGKFYGDVHGQYVATLQAVAASYGIDFDQPWKDVPEAGKQLALDGTGEELFEVSWQFARDSRTGEHHFTGTWKGLSNLVNEEYSRKHADHRGDSMMALMKTACCPACQGSRLRKEALEYTIHGKNISELSSLSVRQSAEFFHLVVTSLTGQKEVEIAIPLVGEILRKLEFLSGLGLSYLSIDRVSASLSGGEARRIKLAGQLGSGLTGITYVFDEPTIGLHPRDTGKLMKQIRSLQEAGNTIIIVEHDRDVILEADHVIDIGPGAGKNGGVIVAEGTPDQIMKNSASVTGPYLSDQINHINPESGEPRIVKQGSHHRNLKPGLSIRNAFANNLKGFDLEIPSAGLIAITGVSGSGKSTLLFEVILASWEKKQPSGCLSIEGFEHFRSVVTVYQRTGFNASLATPATFTGIFDCIRELFAAVPQAKISGFRKSAFSYLNKEGRCSNCEGTGQIRISMDFLPDVKMECEDCHGKRYQQKILACLYQGKNIADILEMSIAEAGLFFNDQKYLSQQLQLLENVGLGYLQLGQPLDSLSGGESQRLALAAELMKSGNGPVLYLFEEPSTGLHFRDIELLLVLFHQLADQGNTLLIIEHDPMMIRQCDHVIELGPEGGDLGGFLK